MTSYRLGDPFFEQFYSRVPRAVAGSFTPAQLDAIKLAFGARTWGTHAVDVRLSFPFLWHRHYLLVLAGRERRSTFRRTRERPRHPLVTIGNAIATMLFGLLCLGPMLAALYAVKSNVGLDLFPDGGVHSFFRALGEQIETMFE